MTISTKVLDLINRNLLEAAADEILDLRTKDRTITTKNREATISKREFAADNLLEMDFIDSISRSDKNVLLCPKDPITEDDREKYPELQQIKDAINAIEAAIAANSPHKGKLTKALIELRQDQYIVREALIKPSRAKELTNHETGYIEFNGSTGYTTDSGDYHLISSEFIDFRNDVHVAAFLKNYAALREVSDDKLSSDMKHMLMDFEKLVDDTLQNSYYKDIVIWKIDGMTNEDIVTNLRNKWGVDYAVPYISTL